MNIAVAGEMSFWYKVSSESTYDFLRFYIDGAEAPTLTMPMTELLGGKADGIPEPIAGQRSRGWNCYPSGRSMITAATWRAARPATSSLQHTLAVCLSW